MQSVSTEIKIFGPKFKKSVVKLIRKAKKRIPSFSNIPNLP